MNTTFLNDKEIAQVESIMAAFGIREFNACVRLWGRGKSIQVTGDVGKEELACLLAIARYLNDQRLHETDETIDYPHVPGTEMQLAEAGV